MLKKDLTFTDFDGNEVTETWYFHLSKPELVEFETSYGDGLSNYLRRLIEAKSGGEIIKTLREIVSLAVGRRSADGRRFVKDEQTRLDFFETEAWPTLFEEIMTAEGSLAFMKGIVPPEFGAKITLDSVNETLAEIQSPPEEGSRKKSIEEYTDVELREMPQDVFDRTFGVNAVMWPPRVLQAAYARRISTSD